MSARQFDVFINPDPASSKTHPYLIVVQSNILDGFNTRVVAPLIAPTTIPFFERLMPVIVVGDDKFVIDPTNMAAVHVHYLRDWIANVESERERILAAIDLVFVGI